MVASCQPRGDAARCEGSRAGASLESQGLVGPFSLCPQLCSEGPCLPFPWVSRVSRVACGSARGTHSLSRIRLQRGGGPVPQPRRRSHCAAPLVGLLSCLEDQWGLDRHGDCIGVGSPPGPAVSPAGTPLADHALCARVCVCVRAHTVHVLCVWTVGLRALHFQVRGKCLRVFL